MKEGEREKKAVAWLLCQQNPCRFFFFNGKIVLCKRSSYFSLKNRYHLNLIRFISHIKHRFARLLVCQFISLFPSSFVAFTNDCIELEILQQIRLLHVKTTVLQSNDNVKQTKKNRKNVIEVYDKYGSVGAGIGLTLISAKHRFMVMSDFEWVWIFDSSTLYWILQSLEVCWVSWNWNEFRITKVNTQSEIRN